MLQLNLPPFDIKLKKTDAKVTVFDRLRRKYVACTPEEWVRQHFINYLVTEKGYPEALIANEVQVELNKQKKRCDTVVYNRTLNPLVIIEYKAPSVEITQEVFDQIVRYNIVLKVQHLIVSNGLKHFCCVMDYDKMSYAYLADIPHYTSLVT